MVKNLPAYRRPRFDPMGLEDPLEKEMATHSSISAWRIPYTEEPSRLQSMGVQVRHDWVTKHSTAHLEKSQKTGKRSDPKWSSSTYFPHFPHPTQSAQHFNKKRFICWINKWTYHKYTIIFCFFIKEIKGPSATWAQTNKKAGSGHRKPMSRCHRGPF